MDITKLKEKLIGKKLLTIIYIDPNVGNNQEQYKKITGEEYNTVNTIQIMLFEDKQYVAFIDFGCDGYRSGDWYVVDLTNWLDNGSTKEIKNINSVVKDIEYIENYEKCGTEKLMLITDDYIVSMGQDNCQDYYPSNFFNIEECKNVVRGNVIKLK